MDAAHSCERHVTRLEGVLDPVEAGDRRSLLDHVGLFQRMVVGAGDSALLVLDHEHGLEVGAEVGVHHHLDGDPAVDEERGAHAGRHCQEILGLTAGVHVRRGDVAERTGARIAGVHRGGLSVDPGFDEERVTLEVGLGLGSQHVRPPGLFPSGVAPAMRTADRDDAVVARCEPGRSLHRLDDHLARQDVERLLERMQVLVDRPPRIEIVDSEARVDRPRGGVVDCRPASVPGAATVEGARHDRRRLRCPLDDVT